MGTKNLGQRIGTAAPAAVPAAVPDQMVDVGGYCLHAIVRGQGSPTVVLEPALGGFAQQYALIQSRVAVFTRVVAYDRAGQGWSEVSPKPRTPDVLTGELHQLLHRLGLQPPYILVGHSFGGLLARIYAGKHPEETAGVVLIDSTHENEYDPFPNVDVFVSRAAFGVRLIKFASRLGLGKQITKLSMGDAVKSIPKEELDTYLTVASQPKHHETMVAEFSQHRCYFGQDTQVPKSLRSTPLAVVTAGNSVSGKAKIGKLTADQMNDLHQKLQKDLLNLSTDSEQVLVPGATHFSIFSQPEDVEPVVEAIRRMVERLRGA